MPVDPTVLTPVHFFDFDAQRFDSMVQEWGWPKFRGQQVRDWVYGKTVTDPASMSNLRKADQDILVQRVRFVTSDLASQQQSSDGTRKLLLTWQSGANAETVMIPDGPRRTACVSSQVGCPVGCKFCASGVNGVKGNLTAGQIVEQIFRLNLFLHPEKERINHVVFMGMGEPLANYANVLQAIRVMHDLPGFNIGARKITISTVGVPPKMRALAEEDLPLNLAISLHAPNEELRKQLIPWAEHFSLEDILSAARYYFDRTGREVTLEYILLSGVNDQSEHARQLAKLCKTLRVNVNLIRYNEVQGLPFTRPRSEDVVTFQDILRNAGVNAHVRKSRGRDIDAACGQLRRNKIEEASLGPAMQTSRTQSPAGFSLAELLVVIVIIGILASIFIPYFSKIRESDRRVRCEDNLRAIMEGMRHYAALKDSHNKPTHFFPSVAHDKKFAGYNAYTGADSPNPFARDTHVKANDVTASLWLLVRQGLVPASRFICPSASQSVDPMLTAGVPVSPDQRSNFTDGSHLSYSYASPFSKAGAKEYNLSEDSHEGDFALMADKNPGIAGKEDNVALPAWNAPPFELARANSRNHGKVGQNVLYADGHVAWQTTPYCGIGKEGRRDNIYTVLSRTHLSLAEHPPVEANGYFGHDLGPAWMNDSYLVPAEGD